LADIIFGFIILNWAWDVRSAYLFLRLADSEISYSAALGQSLSPAVNIHSFYLCFVWAGFHVTGKTSSKVRISY
jgi:hypothetical protein